MIKRSFNYEIYADFQAIKEQTRLYASQIKASINKKYNITENELGFLQRLEYRDSYEELKVLNVNWSPEKISQSIREKIRSAKRNNEVNNKSYELFELLRMDKFPANRAPAHGIKLVPLKYHKQNVTKAEDEDHNVGEYTHPFIHDLIHREHPNFIPSLEQWCRPLATAEAVFKDFNYPQYPSEEPSDERLDEIMKLVMWALDPIPYRPLGSKDFLFGKLPLNTGTGYYNKRSYEATSHAKYSSPELYKDQPTTKGYFLNYNMMKFRYYKHWIKRFGVPFHLSRIPQTPEEWKFITRNLQLFFNMRPTNLYTRLHISKRAKEEPKKARPVYGVDDIFLDIETCLTLPLIVQARRASCSIMHSLETLRGSNQYIDKVAQEYNSYLTLDYTKYDQTVPRVITDKYFTEFLPRVIVVNKGRQRNIFDSLKPEQLKPEKLYMKTRNTLWFLHLWYNNMTFLTADGYAYKRTYAGVPSGLLNTQEIDSFANLFVIFDSLLEYGLTPDQIKKFRFFVMGDDNSIFTPLDIFELTKIFNFITEYTERRWHMIINPSKSIITDNRQMIETLSYQCNFGLPRKNLHKLCAQLCFPEHGIVEKYMSSRAIGIAYASCGQSYELYLICKKIYEHFKDVAVNDAKQMTKMLKYMPGTIKLLEEPGKFLYTLEFPTFEEIKSPHYKWLGVLPFKNKWDENYFIDPPNQKIEGAITLYEMSKIKGHKLEVPINFV